MTHLEPTPNPLFWQALGEYMRARIVEQVVEKPEPTLIECSECGDLVPEAEAEYGMCQGCAWVYGWSNAA